MAKHPKTFQTVEGRALNTKRSLISIATMAALGLVASTGGAANVQYDGLGIKPQFQDYAKNGNEDNSVLTLYDEKDGARHASRPRTFFC